MPLLRKTLRRAGIAAFWLLLWWLAAKAIGQQLLLPTPYAVLENWIGSLASATFWRAVAASLLRIIAGFIIGAALGAALAVLTEKSRLCRELFSPLLSLAKATPVASFIVLALVWIKIDRLPVFATVLVVMPLFWGNLSAAIAALDPDLLEMARAFQMPRRKKLTEVIWPSLLPALRGAILSGMGMAWKSGIAAEVICTPRDALGTSLYLGKVYLDTPSLFATTATIILLSLLLERLAIRLAGGVKGGRRHAGA